MPCISMALFTRSVVVPGTSETRAVSCPVKALISDDLPLLRRPKIAICRRLALGVLFIFMNSILKSKVTFSFYYLFQIMCGYLFYFGIGDMFQFFLD